MAEEADGGESPPADSWQRYLSNGSGGAAWGDMIAALRSFLDTIAAASPNESEIAALGADLAAWTRRLAPSVGPEDRQIFGRRQDLPWRGQSMIPAIDFHACDAQTLHAAVTFGRYFLGGNGAAHGGAVTLMFDEVLGRIANFDRPRSRTAYLHVDFRAITPLDTVLDVRARYVSEEGRKRIIRAGLWHGETLCAEAEGLFVALRPGQP